MGYYSSLGVIRLQIKKQHFANVLKTLKKSAEDFGQDYGWGQNIESLDDLAKAFETWSYEIEIDPKSGDICNASFVYGYGLKDVFNHQGLWEALAPFVENGSRIDIEGEDRDDRTRWLFKNGKMLEKHARISWR